jgi:hypothetical protein
MSLYMLLTSYYSLYVVFYSAIGVAVSVKIKGWQQVCRQLNTKRKFILALSKVAFKIPDRKLTFQKSFLAAICMITVLGPNSPTRLSDTS